MKRKIIAILVILALTIMVPVTVAVIYRQSHFSITGIGIVPSSTIAPSPSPSIEPIVEIVCSPKSIDWNDDTNFASPSIEKHITVTNTGNVAVKLTISQADVFLGNGGISPIKDLIVWDKEGVVLEAGQSTVAKFTLNSGYLVEKYVGQEFRTLIVVTGEMV